MDSPLNNKLLLEGALKHSSGSEKGDAPIVEVDAFMMDICLGDSDNPKHFSRPVIYSLIDAKSRMLVGLDVVHYL